MENLVLTPMRQNKEYSKR